MHRVVVPDRMLFLMPALLVASALAGCTAGPEAADVGLGTGSTDNASSDPAGNLTTNVTVHEAPKGLKHVEPGKAAPDFTLTTTEGETFTLSDHRGKVVLIEFMAINCGVCRANLPAHKDLWANYSDEPDFVFIGLDAWETETEEELRQYRADEGLGWALAMGNNTVERAYGYRGTPTHFFIDHEGQIHSEGRKLSYDTMVTELEYLLDRRDNATAAPNP